jgi:hypothetical protein
VPIEPSDEVIVFLLRMAVVGLLYLFLLSLFVLTQRELRAESAARAPAPAAARLIVLDPGTTARPAGQAIVLQPVTRIGRASESTIVLDDDFVSANHALLLLREGRWWLRDEGSTNGTAVNGAIIRDEAVLYEGDEVQIGQVRLRLAS